MLLEKVSQNLFSNINGGDYEAWDDEEDSYTWLVLQILTVKQHSHHLNMVLDQDYFIVMPINLLHLLKKTSLSINN